MKETLNTLVRDLTKVGSIPKSEAKRRIKNYVHQVVAHAAYVREVHTLGDLMEELRKIK